MGAALLAVARSATASERCAGAASARPAMQKPSAAAMVALRFGYGYRVRGLGPEKDSRSLGVRGPERRTRLSHTRCTCMHTHARKGYHRSVLSLG
mmetsp:Transcript_30255/g.96506  ORF Transcript_30255/g.96506 Transcript_30255/m.96506 type:complete len:95 (+) Transcript_30255:313-597(+)